jgi:hypothetical protein
MLGKRQCGSDERNRGAVHISKKSLFYSSKRRSFAAAAELTVPQPPSLLCRCGGNAMNMQNNA